MGIKPGRGTFNNALTPAALRHENLVFRSGEMLVNQIVPVSQAHGVILADAEALLLMRADDIADQVPEQPPIVQLALPGLHGVVVGTTIKPQRKQALEGLFCEQEGAAR